VAIVEGWRSDGNDGGTSTENGPTEGKRMRAVGAETVVGSKQDRPQRGKMFIMAFVPGQVYNKKRYSVC